MQSKDLEVFNDMPFYFWVKDEEGRYIFVNRALAEMAQQDIMGKTDREMGWAADAEGLRADDKQVLETGKTLYVQEYAHVPSRGKVTLNVCKFLGEFDGKKCVFGISFVIEKKAPKGDAVKTNQNYFFRRSARITWAALRPGAMETPPPGWLPEAQR